MTDPAILRTPEPTAPDQSEVEALALLLHRYSGWPGGYGWTTYIEQARWVISEGGWHR